MTVTRLQASLLPLPHMITSYFFSLYSNIPTPFPPPPLTVFLFLFVLLHQPTVRAPQSSVSVTRREWRVCIRLRLMAQD
ncbi:hypothetical protein E2C01_041769 [Portunus trituberculatus]|uniref:Uncharacterized protein n=1 Tax=Portunus trituberculatus TaxID=210409 RepID=A0A5B7FRJ6_PORTR|nr:hypothetical protein [Portunus trituberculatus]